MINDDLKNLLAKIREAAERVNKRHDDLFYNDLTGMCLICSTVIVTVLRKLGDKTAVLAHGCCLEEKHYRGIANHCWVEYKGHILDITVTQFRNGFINFFDRPPKPVEIIPLNEEVQEEAYLKIEELPANSIQKAYSWAMDSGWPTYQCPYPKLVKEIIAETGLFA